MEISGTCVPFLAQPSSWCIAASPLWLPNSPCQVKVTTTAPPVNPDLRTCTQQTSAALQCGTDGMCAPTPPTGTLGPCVIAKQPGLSCPPGYTYYSPAVYEGKVDTRACDGTGCNCDPAGSCNSSGGLPNGVNVYAGTSCGALLGTIPVDGTCQPVPKSDGGSSDLATKLVGYTGTGSCAPTGDALPGGDVTGTQAWTVCCMQ